MEMVELERLCARYLIVHSQRKSHFASVCALEGEDGVVVKDVVDQLCRSVKLPGVPFS
jgi:hypothetical protein